MGNAGEWAEKGLNPGLDLRVPRLDAAPEATLFVPLPPHPLVDGPSAWLEAHEEAEAPCQAAVEGHGHHDEGGHDDEAEDDQGGGAVVVQDGLAVIGCGVEHLQMDREKGIRSQVGMMPTSMWAWVQNHCNTICPKQTFSEHY